MLIPRCEVAFTEVQNDSAEGVGLHLDHITLVVVVCVQDAAKCSEGFAPHQTT
jgi:hypothetical protein